MQTNPQVPAPYVYTRQWYAIAFDLTKRDRIIVLLAYSFVRKNYAKIRERYQEDGGCEPWFQPELASYIRTFEELGGTAKYAVREHKLWKNSGDKVDIVTTYVRKYEYEDTQGREKQKILSATEAIELKCASWKQDAKPGDFGRRFKSDIDKLWNGRNNMEPFSYANQDVFYFVALGITTEQAFESTKAYLQNQNLLDNVQYRTYAPDGEEGRGITVWSFWGYKTP
jgi:hypothetical protein